MCTYVKGAPVKAVLASSASQKSATLSFVFLERVGCYKSASPAKVTVVATVFRVMRTVFPACGLVTEYVTLRTGHRAT